MASISPSADNGIKSSPQADKGIKSSPQADKGIKSSPQGDKGIKSSPQGDKGIKSSDTFEWDSAKIRAASTLTNEKPTTQEKKKQSIFQRLNCFKVLKQEIPDMSNLEQIEKYQNVVDSCPIMVGRSGSFKGERKKSVCEKQNTDRKLVYKTIANYRQSTLIKDFI